MVIKKLNIDFKRALALLLCAVIFASAMPIFSFAAEDDTPTDDDPQVEPTPTVLGYISAHDFVIAPGREIELTVYLSAKGALAVTSKIEFSSDLMSFVGAQSESAGFNLSVSEKTYENGQKYLDLFSINSTLDRPLEELEKFVTLKFRINENLGENSKISLKMTDAVASNGVNDFKLEQLEFESAVIFGDTGECDIQSLKIDGTLLGNFDPKVTLYELSVEYLVTSLSLDVQTQNGATVTVRGNDKLVIGENTVMIEVKSKGGQTKTYTLKVTRKSDPSHEISKDSGLADIILSSGILSPKIEKDVFDYLVYVSMETEMLKITPVPASEWAKSEAVEVYFDNETTSQSASILVIAEDGSATAYSFTIMKLPNYNGKIPLIEENAPKDPIDDQGSQSYLPEFLVSFMAENGIDNAELWSIVIISLAILMAFVLVLALVIALSKKHGGAVQEADEPKAFEADESVINNDTNTEDEDLEDF